MTYITEDDRKSVLLTMELQRGVFVVLKEEETVHSFILRILSIDKDSMDREVQTLILNNGCVDEPESRILVPGDTLVLSGAMPGLVGAMLRSNSPIKAMRQTLSDSSKRRDDTIPDGMIRLKLFNTVLTDHKEDLLKWGFYLQEDSE